MKNVSDFNWKKKQFISALQPYLKMNKTSFMAQGKYKHVVGRIYPKLTNE